MRKKSICIVITLLLIVIILLTSCKTETERAYECSSSLLKFTIHLCSNHEILAATNPEKEQYPFSLSQLQKEEFEELAESYTKVCENLENSDGETFANSIDYVITAAAVFLYLDNITTIDLYYEYPRLASYVIATIDLYENECKAKYLEINDLIDEAIPYMKQFHG
jgi:hypothetical protein